MRVSQRTTQPFPVVPFFIILMLVIFFAGAVYLLFFRRPAAPNGPTQAPGQPVQKLFEDGKIYGGIPRATDPDHEFEILVNAAYVTGYSERYRDPLWSSTHLRRVGQHFHDPRPATFSVDDRTLARTETRDYARSGYDRGHMTPNSAIDTLFGPDAQRETFLMSNIVPQLHSLNAGVWEDLEKYAYDQSQHFGDEWVFCGPVFQEPVQKLRGGEAIPASCWKILIVEIDGEPNVLAFEMPQDAPENSRVGSFRVAVKKIEEDTHLSFFDSLGPAEKAKLEAEGTGPMW